MKRLALQLLLSTLITTACKEDFEPPVIQQGASLLVVDGFINNSSDTTMIRLSRTNKLGDGVRNSQEKGASLFLEDSAGNTLYTFQELNDSGRYFIPGISLDINSKYRLRIVTSNSKQYLSDEIPVISTPAIDSISYGRMGNSFAVYANTHDPQNKTKYYRWEYTETWQYRASFFSSLMVTSSGIIDRPPDKYVYECWKTQQNIQLLLGSSAKLAEDLIYHYPLRTMDLNSIELSIKYFIFLRQYALPKEGYEYLENLKKITEETGSLFDAQPSQLNGNIHGTAAKEEPVLGYLVASTPTTKQMYITNADVQPWDYNPGCVMFEVPAEAIAGAFTENSLIPLSLDGSAFSLKGIYATTYSCGDCTALGGVTTKPGFWQ